jgi:hypothetical protein
VGRPFHLTAFVVLGIDHPQPTARLPEDVGRDLAGTAASGFATMPPCSNSMKWSKGKDHRVTGPPLC